MAKIQQFGRFIINLKFSVIFGGMFSDTDNTRDKYLVEHQYLFVKCLFGLVIVYYNKDLFYFIFRSMSYPEHRIYSSIRLMVKPQTGIGKNLY